MTKQWRKGTFPVVRYPMQITFVRLVWKCLASNCRRDSPVGTVLACGTKWQLVSQVQIPVGVERFFHSNFRRSGLVAVVCGASSQSKNTQTEAYRKGSRSINWLRVSLGKTYARFKKLLYCWLQMIKNNKAMLFCWAFSSASFR